MRVFYGWSRDRLDTVIEYLIFDGKIQPSEVEKMSLDRMLYYMARHQSYADKIKPKRTRMVAKTVETKIVFSAIDRVSQKMKQISGSFAPLEKKMRSLGQNFQSIGTRMTLGGGAGLYAGFQGLLKPAMDFEQAMAGVYKVLDPSEVGLTDKQFSDHIHSLVPVLKKGAIDIAGSFQAGAQAGISF